MESNQKITLLKTALDAICEIRQHDSNASTCLKSAEGFLRQRIVYEKRVQKFNDNTTPDKSEV